MPVRDWLGRPRHVLVVFLAVAAVSAAALGSLAWQLLAQDAALDATRRQERLEQAADRATAIMQRALADLQTRLGAENAGDAPLPPGVSVVSIGPGGVAVWPVGSLLYSPVPVLGASAPAGTFAEGERLEFARRDRAAAMDVYSALARSNDAAVRAGALLRLARVQRKQKRPDAALRTYDQLAALDRVNVDDLLPAGLAGRIGRASVFEDGQKTAELRTEAAALADDLHRGRWPVLRPTYELYTAKAGEWLGASPREDADARTRADAVDWLWSNRATAETIGRRMIALSNGPALVGWKTSPDRLDTFVAGPAYLAALGAEAFGGDVQWALSDLEGRRTLGDAPPSRPVAVRTAAVASLPWTLHVFAPPGQRLPVSPRRSLLVLVLSVVAMVLAAGWYFILRALSRELSVGRLQSDFVAAVSHEFRSPLTSLSHIADMLARDRFPLDALRRQAYDALVRDADRLRDLVEGLLDFGRFEAGATAFRFEPVDVGGLVRTTVAEFQERAAADGYTIELAGATDEVSARADREALTRALWNLLDNAVKYSPDSRTIRVEVTRRPDRVGISVRDHGLGIPLDEQRTIFDRFVRGTESKARRIRGTGIGLAMVRQIVRAHGGEIAVTSAPGQGSVFTILLPMTG